MASKKMYLVAFYYMRPRHQRVRTNVPGWIKDEQNISWDEQIAITTKLKDRDYASGKIILNLSDRVVLTNGWTGSRDFDELFDHFYKNYKNDLHKIATELGYFKQPTIDSVENNSTVFSTDNQEIKTVATETVNS